MFEKFTISNNLAKFIKAKRQDLKLTQEMLAQKSKIDYKHIQNFESLKRENDPKLSTLIKLANAFNITVTKILNKILK